MDQPALAAELPFLRTTRRSELKNQAVQPERIGPISLLTHDPRIGIGFDAGFTSSGGLSCNLSERGSFLTMMFNVWGCGVV